MRRPSPRRTSRQTVTCTARLDPRLLVRFAGAGAAARDVSLGALVGAEPEAQVAVDWVREEWTRGSYLILGPGQLLDWGGRLGEPHGRVHFAGVERAALKSYMEGRPGREKTSLRRYSRRAPAEAL